MNLSVHYFMDCGMLHVMVVSIGQVPFVRISAPKLMPLTSVWPCLLSYSFYKSLLSWMSVNICDILLTVFRPHSTFSLFSMISSASREIEVLFNKRVDNFLL